MIKTAPFGNLSTPQLIRDPVGTSHTTIKPEIAIAHPMVRRLPNPTVLGLLDFAQEPGLYRLVHLWRS